MIPIKDDNPCYTFPFVTIFIIAVNIMVYIYQLTLSPHMLQKFYFTAGLIPYELTHFTDIGPKNIVPLPFTFLTSTFVHGNFLHIAGNMLYLWIFGDNVEDAMGHLRFIVFYALCGTFAGTFHLLSSVSSTMPMVGASGAIAGVLGAYFVLFPKAQVVTLVFLLFFITFVRIPAILVLGVWFIVQMLNASATRGGSGGVAWFAHIGGFLFGAFVIRKFLKLRPPRRPFKVF